jgi:hypothetical protein
MRSDVGVRCKKCKMELSLEVPRGGDPGKTIETIARAWNEHRKACAGVPEWLKNGRGTS